MSGVQVPLRRFDTDVEDALEDVNVPAYVLDRHGFVRWLNRAGQRLMGDVRGQRFSIVVAPADNLRARATFARNIAGGTGSNDVALDVISTGGEQVRVDVSSVPLRRGGRVVGMFGLAPIDKRVRRRAVSHPHLTPRQTEVLKHLAHGHSTAQMAKELHLSPDTVRNHVRRLLMSLGVHSRLEAVALAHAEGLLEN